jgi:hypothetical protein
MVTDFNEAAQALLRAVLTDHPAWAAHVFPYGPADDPDANDRSVRLSIPAPAAAAHRLEIVQRGNTIEVAYDCGRPGLRAEQQFVFADDDLAEAVAEVQTFVNRLCAGELVIVREALNRTVRARRTDGVSELAWFRTAEDAKAARPGRYVAMHAWTVDPLAGGGAA